MAVYVDNMRASFRQMIMCHMLADSLDELHAMADKIGVARKWFQRYSRIPHYDICLSKKALAISHGAVQLTTHKETAAVMNKWRNGPTHPPQAVPQG